MYRIFVTFSSVASTSVDLLSMKATEHRIVYGALAAVTMYTDTFVSSFDLDPYEHKSYMRTHCYIYVKHRIDIMHDIGFEISPKYCRY